MNRNLTEVVFILDRSGSMSGLEADTIGGYNSMLSRQKEEEGDAVISTVLFNDRTEVLHDRRPLHEVKEITENEYFVRGTTALLDAVGGAIRHIDRIQKELPEEERPEKTLFIITTDGMENSSRKYSYSKVRKLVEKKKKKLHWEFVFLGANMDAIEVAGKFGVSANRAVRYECDSTGTRLNFEVMSRMVSAARACPSSANLQKAFDADELLAAIQEDYRKRHKV